MSFKIFYVVWSEAMDKFCTCFSFERRRFFWLLFPLLLLWLPVPFITGPLLLLPLVLLLLLLLFRLPFFSDWGGSPSDCRTLSTLYESSLTLASTLKVLRTFFSFLKWWRNDRRLNPRQIISKGNHSAGKIFEGPLAQIFPSPSNAYWTALNSL